ncbi:MAG TPA: acyl-CoA dehydrogenase family protein [Bacteroidaceae bacterium]|nr:acyl-CoA dehydrogenase family protein [Bacteroidaceae bacterium]MBP8602678.1 acyl-CoA dehydrogenase family protein [Bacteroidaceae bacterium]HOD67962.1 acyl-CoA dehydrogenase family protein [Bacteroidaceae bacterium]HQL25531.1 acyl-CoA dehydrogenase family protein [Bacteroidaceae bacterium]
MNRYKDTPELEARMHSPLMERIVELKENFYAEAGKYDYAPTGFADAMDNYDRVLELTGTVCADVIGPNAESVDREGAHCSGGRVQYSKGTAQNLKVMHQAGMSGFGLPRQYGGLNMPVTVFSAVCEMISRSDASFQNVWGLQSCADTIYEFGSEEQKEKYLKMACEGATMSMDLTEPDAGSDLQSVMLKATEDVENGCWRLNGVKRFITNGDSDVHLVLARSEEGTTDGRGLSLFIYDKRDGGVNVRRIEDKMGIHGSPTCELVFNNAKAELCGSRRLGLIKYVMALMNGARLGIATQSVGIQDAAWREAVAFAAERRQFGVTIDSIPAVYQMLALMKAKLEASRSLLYETSRYVDIYKSLDAIAKTRALTSEERAESKRYSRLADALTPIAKGMTSEFANQNTYDSIQVHGGSGFMRDYACERLYRDARITSIYEGTTQLQVVAALRYVTAGSYLQYVREMLSGLPESKEKEAIMAMVDKLDAMTAYVTEFKSQEFNDFCGRRLMESAAYCVMSTLLLRDSTEIAEIFDKPLKVFIDYSLSQLDGHYSVIMSRTPESMDYYR